MYRLSILAALATCAPAVAANPPASAVAYRADGLLLAVGSQGRVILANPATGEDLATLAGVPGRVTALAFSPAGLLAVACGEPGKSGVVRLYDCGPGKPLPVSPAAEWAAHKDAVYALAFAPDGGTLATAGYDRVIHLWPLPGTPTKPRLTLTDHSDAVYALAFAPDGKLLASGSADRAVKVWDPATGKRLYTLGDPTDWVYAVAWHPDGKTLAAGGVDKSVRTWAVTRDGGTLTKSAFAHDGAVVRLAYGPGGGTLFSAGEDRVLKAWDAAKLVETRVFPPQPDAVLGLAVRPDGKQLAVARFDGVAATFDPATGTPGPTAFPLKPWPATITSVTPAFAPRGTTVRIALTGTRLDGVTAVTASDPGITAKLLPAGRTATRLEVELAIAPTATPGGVKLAAVNAAGGSMPAAFQVDRFPAVLEQGVTDSVTAAMPVTLPVTVLGTLDRAGDVDYFRFDAAAGQHVGVELAFAAGRIDPVLTVSDADGKTLADGNAALGFVAPKAGRYAVAVRDREYRGGPDFAYRLHAGPVPVVTSVFPLGVPAGRETSVHVEGVNLGSPHGRTVKVTVPAGTAAGTRIPVAVPGEPPVGAAAVVVGAFPAVVASADGGADLRSVPGTADGIIGKPGDVQTVKFTAKKGQNLVVEVHARRLGSPLDPAIEILDAAGKPVPRAALRCTAKTVVTFRDHDSATANIRLDAWNELAVDDYLYVGGELVRIKNLPGHPDADCEFARVGGQRVAYLDTTPAHHAQNSPMYRVEIHPPGKSFPANGMPVFTLAYRNDDGGPGFGKDSRLFFDCPADGTYQVRVTDARGAGGPGFAYRLTVRHPEPQFKIDVSTMNPAVWKNGAVPVTVTATRIDGFDGPIELSALLPAPFAFPKTRIEAGQTTASAALFAGPDTPAAGEFRVLGTAIINGKPVTREATGGTPTVVEPGDIVTTTTADSVTIKPGGGAKIRVKIERRNGHAGRVPLDVRGLPHGVRVLNLGLNGILINETETERDILFAAEPWVKPMTLPFVVLARSERKGTEHAAKSVVLKVE